MLAGRLRAMDEALADSVFLDVTGRTAKRLLELAGDDDEFTLPVTQEELAGMVGASRERVNKAIVVVRPPRLARAAPTGATRSSTASGSAATVPLTCPDVGQPVDGTAIARLPGVGRVVGTVRRTVGSCTKPCSASG